MGKWYESTEVVCCWYKGEGGYKIICQGIYEASSLIQTFPTERALRDHQSRYCRNHSKYRSCPIARMLAEREAQRKESDE